MYRHRGSLCETDPCNNAGNSSDNGTSMPKFVRRTSLRDMLRLGDVDDLIEAEEDVKEATHSSGELRFHAKGIPIPPSPNKNEGPIVGK